MENTVTYETKITICGNEDDTEFKDFAVELFNPAKTFCEENREQIKYSAIINDKNIVEFRSETQNERISKMLNNCLMALGVVLVAARAAGRCKGVTTELKSTLKLV